MSTVQLTVELISPEPDAEAMTVPIPVEETAADDAPAKLEAIAPDKKEGPHKLGGVAILGALDYDPNPSVPRRRGSLVGGKALFGATRYRLPQVIHRRF